MPFSTRIRALLAFARRDRDGAAGAPRREELAPASFDVQACVEEVLERTAEKAAAKNLDLICQVANGVPPALVGDVASLRRVLLELAGNGVRFTERGEVVIQVAVERGEGDRHRVHFAVRDTGVGMSVERRDRLFQPVAPAEASTIRPYCGAGYGLAISKRLVEAMGGTIRVESEDGKGSLFYFSIVAAAGVAGTPPRPGLTPQLDGRRILMVDDNATSLRILAAQCTGWGLDVLATRSPLEALEWVRMGRFLDLAVVDAHMPEMDGVALARQIRRLRDAASLPLLGLGSSASPERKDARLFAAHLPKPVKEASLHAALLAALAGAAAPRPERPSSPRPARPARSWQAAGGRGSPRPT